MIFFKIPPCKKEYDGMVNHMILFLKTEAIHLKKVDGHPFFLHNRINSLRQLDLLKTEMLH